MQKFPSRQAISRLLLCGVLPLTACDAPQAMQVPSAPLFSSVSGAALLECPSAQSQAATKRILPFGGVVGVAGNAVVVPAAALHGIVDIGIVVPASRHMRVDLRANDQEHWQFLAPVTVTIDYSRCSPQALGHGPLSVWHIDSNTGVLLENMGGVDDRLLKRITFTTDHFSGYAIAN